MKKLLFVIIYSFLALNVSAQPVPPTGASSPTAYISIATQQTSNSTASPFNPFSGSSYAFFSAPTAYSSLDISYTPTDGRFTVTNAGVYYISGLARVAGSGTYIDISIKKNGSNIHTTQAVVLNNLQYEAHAILTLSASDYVEFIIDSTTATVVQTSAIEFNMMKIAN